MPDRIALVTGGSRGLGRAIALELARDGMIVAVNYRTDLEGAQATVAAIQDEGRRAVLAPFDIADRQQVRNAVKTLTNDLGVIDVLVNNAAVASLKPLLRTHDADLQAMLQTNVAGTIHCAREVLRTWTGGRTGSRIINITSYVAECGISDSSVYAASKAALIGFTRSLACELGPKQVTVNCVSPGVFATDSLAGHGVNADKMVERTPLGRIGRPEEVAWLVSFLASERASFITGQTICIDGGAST